MFGKGFVLVLMIFVVSITLMTNDWLTAGIYL